VYIWFEEDWRNVRVVLRSWKFSTIVIPRELRGLFEKLDDGSSLFYKFGQESEYGGEAAYLM